MELKETLLKEHSKAQCNRIVQWVGTDQKRFDELFYFFLQDEYRLAQRAAWPVGLSVETYPLLLQKHWTSFIKNLQCTTLHNAVKRNSIRLLQTITIPERFQGAVMDTCFKYLASPHEPIAVKVFSMTVLAKLAEIHPDIVPELKLHIENELLSPSKAFKSRATHVLKRLNS